jgi:hypothetical protein
MYIKMPSLRGHHLICLHFFHGESYDQEFIDNLESILLKIGDGAVEIVSGADHICLKCPFLKDMICQYSTSAEEDIRDMDEKALELLNLSVGTQAKWSKMKEALPSLFNQWYASHCKDCDWQKDCEKNTLFRRLRNGLSE